MMGVSAVLDVGFICLAYVLLWELFILFVYVLVENEKCHSLACQLLNLK